MSKIIVLGLDPSMSNFGMIKGYLCLDTLEFTPFSSGISKHVEPKHKTVRQNSYDLNVAKTHFKNIQKALVDVDLVFVEMPVGSQNARSMTSYGMCLGLIASIDIPLIIVTPTEVKLAATGNKTATKKDMINWAVSKHPNFPWKMNKRTKTPLNTNEHIADALAAIYAGLNTETFKQAHLFLNK